MGHCVSGKEPDEADRRAGDKRPPCSSCCLLLSIGVIKAQYQLPKTTPHVSARTQHTPFRHTIIQYTLHPRQMYTGCILTFADSLEPAENIHAGFMRQQLGSLVIYPPHSGL